MSFLRPKFILMLFAALALLAGQSAQSQAIGTSASNKDVARRFISAMATADAPTIQAVLGPHSNVRLRIAGVYSPELNAYRDGIEWDRNQLIRLQQDRRKAMNGPFSVKIISMISDGEYVAAETIGTGIRAATNQPYVQHYSYHLKIRDGKIVDAHVYEDTFHEWNVWQNAGASADFGALPPASKATPLTLSRTASPEQRAANKQAVRRWVAALVEGDAGRLRAEFAPDHVWSFAMGGDYSPDSRSFVGGARWDLDGMVKLQSEMHVGLEGPFTLDIYSLIAEGNEVSAELIGIAAARGGLVYRQHYSIHFKFRAGKIVEGHVYQDTLHQYDLRLKRDKYAPIASPIRPKR